MAAQQFLALVFSGNSVTAVLWQHMGHTAAILDQSTAVPMKSESVQHRNEAVDIAIDQLGKPAVEVKRVLFGLPSHWMHQGGMSASTKSFLKHLTHDLILEPLGFVVNTDALADWYRQRDRRPFAGAFLTTLRDSCLLDVYAHGELTETQTFGRSGEDDPDAEEVAARLNALPEGGHTVVIGSVATDEAFLNALEKRLNASLEVLSESQAVATIVQTGGSAIVGDSDGAGEEPALAVADAAPTPPAPNADFTVPAFLTPAEAEESTHDGPPSDPPDDEGTLAVLSVSPKRSLKFRRPVWRLPHLRVPHLRAGSWKLGIVVVPALLLVLLVGTLLAMPQRFGQLSYEVTLAPEELRASTEVVLRADGGSATASGSTVLEVEEVSVELTKETEVPTTGKKVTGDKAKGTVTIYNKTDQSKSFAAGTKLTVGKLLFVTDQEVTVASASTTESSGSSTKTFGSKDVAVTANAIGADSNIAKDQEFTVANFGSSSFSARNKDAFSGGSSRDIQAVAKKDIDNAAASLRSGAAEELTASLREQGTDLEPVLPLDTAELVSVEPSVAVGEEASTVTVRAMLKATGLRLKSETLSAAAETLLADQLSGRTILPTQPIRFIPATLEASGTKAYTARGEMVAQVLPSVSVSEVKQELNGLPIPRAEQKLRELAGATRVVISVRPRWLRPIFSRTPKKSEDYQLTIRIGETP